MERKQRTKHHVSTRYPKSSVRTLKAIFDEMDADGSGDLDRHELTAALKKRKQDAQRHFSRCKTLAERQAQNGRVQGQSTDMAGTWLVDFAESMFDALDANSDERVEFRELLKIVYPLAGPEELSLMVAWVTPVRTEDDLRREEAERMERERVAALRQMFGAFDRDKDGKVSLTEFRMAMLDHQNWDEVDDLFEQYDRNGNGEVDFEEFCAIVSPDPE